MRNRPTHRWSTLGCIFGTPANLGMACLLQWMATRLGLKGREDLPGVYDEDSGWIYTVPKDRANWLFEVDLDALGVKWLCLRRYGCYALFLQGNGRAEAHWTCLPRVDVWNALRFCREVLPVAKRILGVPKFYGLTPVNNLRALKMARLLNFVHWDLVSLTILFV